MNPKHALLKRLLLPFTLTLALGACEDDPARPDGGDTREHAVVLNSTGLTLTLFPVAAPDSTTPIALGPSGTPSSIAVRGAWALVPLGTYPAVAVVDLAARAVDDVIPLPAGSGATGVAIVDDSLAFVANPELNTVTPVRYRDGVALDAIEVGVYPTALVAHGDRVYVLEANLVDFVPDGPSTVSVIDAATLQVDTQFTLAGRNAGDALISGDSVLHILNRGDYGLANGSLSIVRLGHAAEADNVDGFGEGTGTLSELDGDLIVSSWDYGLAHFDPQSRSFVVAPANGVKPDGAQNVLASGVDAAGRIYVLDAGDCVAPGTAFVWQGTLADANGDVTPVTVGSCPLDIVFTTF